MTYRSRLATVTGVAVALAVAVASVIVYFSVRAQLHASLARTLAAAAQNVVAGRAPAVAAAGGGGLDAQLVTTDGAITHLGAAGLTLPLVSQAQLVAARKAAPFLSQVAVGQTRLLVYTTAAGHGRAVEVGASLAGVDASLAHLALVLSLVTLGGLVVAAAAGLVSARPLLAPLQRLGDTAEEVAATRDLTRRLDVTADDELGRIASSFNAMMSALEQAVRSQRQLVADASHELRTPLTSLRTNLEVLTRAGRLPTEDRDALVADLVAQLEELTVLVGDLADLARESEPELQLQPVDLEAVVAEASDRARRRSPQHRFEVASTPTWVRGDPGRLLRAVTNLLDNAMKWGPTGTAICVTLRHVDGQAELEVRDHGPGIPPGDLPFIFERFYRAGGDRRLPGSGLGLAIVRQVAEWHGGSVVAGMARGGGALLTIHLPLLPGVNHEEQPVPATHSAGGRPTRLGPVVLRRRPGSSA